MMDINERQDQRYTRDDNNGRDLYLLGVNVHVLNYKVLTMFAPKSDFIQLKSYLFSTDLPIFVA